MSGAVEAILRIPENGVGQRGEEFVDESGHVSRCGNGERLGGSRRSSVQVRQFDPDRRGRIRRIGQGDAAPHRVGLFGCAARFDVQAECGAGGGCRDTGFGHGCSVFLEREDTDARRCGLSRVGHRPDRSDLQRSGGIGSPEARRTAWGNRIGEGRSAPPTIKRQSRWSGGLGLAAGVRRTERSH